MRGSQEQQPFTGRCWGFGGCRCFCRSSRALVKIRSFQSGKRTTTAELRICDSSELGTLLVLGHLALFFLFQEIKNIQFFQGTQCRPNNHKPSCAGEIPCCWWRVRVCFSSPPGVWCWFPTTSGSVNAYCATTLGDHITLPIFGGCTHEFELQVDPIIRDISIYSTFDGFFFVSG